MDRSIFFLFLEPMEYKTEFQLKQKGNSMHFGYIPLYEKRCYFKTFVNFTARKNGIFSICIYLEHTYDKNGST